MAGALRSVCQNATHLHANQQITLPSVTYFESKFQPCVFADDEGMMVYREFTIEVGAKTVWEVNQTGEAIRPVMEALQFDLKSASTGFIREKDLHTKTYCYALTTLEKRQ